MPPPRTKGSNSRRSKRTKTFQRGTRGVTITKQLIVPWIVRAPGPPKEFPSLGIEERKWDKLFTQAVEQNQQRMQDRHNTTGGGEEGSYNSPHNGGGFGWGGTPKNQKAKNPGKRSRRRWSTHTLKGTGLQNLEEDRGNLGMFSALASKSQGRRRGVFGGQREDMQKTCGDAGELLLCL